MSGKVGAVIGAVLDMEREADQIAEALIVEIGRARTWAHVRAAWIALTAVRQMERDGQREVAHLSAAAGMGAAACHRRPVAPP